MSATLWLFILISVIPCFAQSSEPVKPACNVHTRGKLWPEKTTRGASVPIEICAPKRWTFSYTWQQLTIDASQLRAVARRKPVVAGLAMVPTASGEAKPPTGR
jgi:hypothetical protein